MWSLITMVTIISSSPHAKYPQSSQNSQRSPSIMASVSSPVSHDLHLLWTQVRIHGYISLDSKTSKLNKYTYHLTVSQDQNNHNKKWNPHRSRWSIATLAFRRAWVASFPYGRDRDYSALWAVALYFLVHCSPWLCPPRF